MKITTQVMRGEEMQVMPADGQVYAMTNQAFDYVPSSPDYAKALDYTDKNTVSPNDSGFAGIYGPKAETANASVSMSEPLKSEIVVTREVPVFDFKKLLIFGALGYLAYKYFKKGRAA